MQIIFLRWSKHPGDLKFMKPDNMLDVRLHVGEKDMSIDRQADRWRLTDI